MIRSLGTNWILIGQPMIWPQFAQSHNLSLCSSPFCDKYWYPLRHKGVGCAAHDGWLCEGTAIYQNAARSTYYTLHWRQQCAHGEFSIVSFLCSFYWYFLSVQTIGVPVLFASTLKPYDLGLGEHVFKIQFDNAKIISRIVCSVCESTRPSKYRSCANAGERGMGKELCRGCFCGCNFTWTA